MFTGLIEEVGTVKAIKRLGGGVRITVAASEIMDDIKIDDSVALNGACQTVVSLTENSFDVEAVEETMQKTTLGSFRTGSEINLERAAKLGDRMGGHLVQGHVDTVGSVNAIQKLATGVQLWISFPYAFSKYIVPVGSITINGVSLTAARVEGTRFMSSIIPHTWKVTTLRDLKIGHKVNLEFDIIGKYVEKMTTSYTGSSSNLEKYIDQPEF